MAIELIGKIKPKNNGTFAMADAVDIEMPDGSRLTAHLEAKDAEVSEQIATLSGKDAELADQISAQGGKISALEAKDTAVSTQIAALGAKDTAIDQQISTQGQQISDINTFIQEQSKDLAEKETALAQQIASLSQTDQTLAQADTALAKRTKAVEDTLADFSVSYPIETSGTVLQPETYYVFGEVSSLTVSLAEQNDGKVHEYCFEFKPSASFKEGSLSITPKPTWANQLQFVEGKTCQVSIMRGIGVMVCA